LTLTVKTDHNAIKDQWKISQVTCTALNFTPNSGNGVRFYLHEDTVY